MGVRVITAPAEAAAKFRDCRWLEIQPGIAIDLEGNPIVVDPSTDKLQPARFAIASESKS